MDLTATKETYKLELTTQKKWGPRLGPRAPKGASHFPASFSHRTVGSSILASLSEAGGNDRRKPANKSPPRSANLHEPSTETHPTPTPIATAAPSPISQPHPHNLLQIQPLPEIAVGVMGTNLAPKFPIGNHSQSISGILDPSCFLHSALLCASGAIRFNVRAVSS